MKNPYDKVFERRYHWDVYLDWGCWMVGVNAGNGRRFSPHAYLHLGPFIAGVWWERVVRRKAA